MPGIFCEALNRRKFLGHSAKALTAVAFASRARLFAGADKPEELRVALLSDTHIPADFKAGEHRKFLPWSNLRTVAPQVIQARPKAVIINGDAARLTGQLEDYVELKKLLAPVAAEAPVYIGLGNHDDRENFFKVFPQPPRESQSVKEKHLLVIEWPGIRFVVLDSLMYVNRVAGLLGKAQRDWLAQYLERSDGRPTVLFVHHTLDDGDGSLMDAERLFELTRPHKKVKAIFYGHSHKYAFSEQQGVHLVNLPAVGYNFADSEPVGWVDARFTSEGAALTLKAFAGNREGDGKTTSITWKM